MNNPHSRRFDLIAFDWDGTLFDSTQIIACCIQAAVADVGGKPPSREAAAEVIGLGLMQALAHVAPHLPQALYPECAQRYRHHYGLHLNDISLFDGVLPLLHALKARGHLLAVATGKSRQGLDEALSHTALRGLFDASRTADETASKPNPLMLRELMDECGVEPARTLMVGDTSHDLQMALNAACAGLGVNYGAHSEERLRSCRPLYIAPSVVALQGWLLAQA